MLHVFRQRRAAHRPFVKIIDRTLEQASKISIQLKQKGKEPQTVVFEVGGFDPAKFPAPTG